MPTNNPLFAVVNTAKHARSAGTDPRRLEQVHAPTSNWNRSPSTGSTCTQGACEPLTVRILSRNRDVYLDLGGGNRIPKISERQARSVAELRARPAWA